MYQFNVSIGFGLWCFNATFNNISVFVAVSFYWWREQEKTTDKLYHIILYRVHLNLAGFELTTLVVIGTDCKGSYKSNYHMIMATDFNAKV